MVTDDQVIFNSYFFELLLQAEIITIFQLKVSKPIPRGDTSISLLYNIFFVFISVVIAIPYLLPNTRLNFKVRVGNLFHCACGNINYCS
jgi:hypothetical protein